MMRFHCLIAHGATVLVLGGPIAALTGTITTGTLAFSDRFRIEDLAVDEIFVDLASGRLARIQGAFLDVTVRLKGSRRVL